MSRIREKTELGHHALAAIHHEQAARYHQAASIHFHSGKDYAHSSHQALLARGHSLRAIELGRKAIYASPLVSLTTARDHQSSLRADANPLPVAPMTSTGSAAADHHWLAAIESEKAALHERQASALELASDFPAAVRAAKLAEQHSQLALFHSDEAAMYLAL